MKFIKKTVPLLLLFFATPSFFSQTGRNWTISDPFENKAFIENKGQFMGVPGDQEVLFMTNQTGTDYYFCRSGIKISQKEKIHKEEQRAEGKEAEGKYELIDHWINMEWLGVAANHSVEALEERFDYFVYRVNENSIKARSFKKIIYRNIYAHIDIEFSFHEQGGLKYNIILHPGADPSLIKWRYKGKVDVSIENTGDLLIKNDKIKLLDHKPLTFNAKGRELQSVFSINGNEISFKLTGYDSSTGATIDPWVINPTFTTQNIAYDVTHDALGNVYVYGGGSGGSAWQLKQYTSAGALVWTYISPMDEWYGDFAVDQAGNSYLVEGCCSNNIVKLDVSGNVVFVYNHPSTIEMWRLLFTCDYSKLYVAIGYNPAAANSVAEINTTNGNLINPSPSLASYLNGEPRAMAIDNSNIFLLSVATPYIAGFTNTYTNLFSSVSGYTLLYNGPLYSNGSNSTSGQNALAVNKRYLYSSDGATLKRWDKTTGAQLGSVAIPGGAVESNSGTMVDDCGNVYVGSSNAVYKYDSLLNSITSASTGGIVYDVALGNNQEILVCGNGFVSSLSMNSSKFEILNRAKTDAGCACTGSADVTLSCGTPPFTYNWSNGTVAITTALSHNVQNLCAGSYTVTTQDDACHIDTAIFNIVGSGTLLLSSSKTDPTCASPCGGSAAINPSGGSSPYTYLWSNGLTSATISNLCGATYTVTVTDFATCVGATTVTLNAASSFTAGTTINGNVTCFGRSDGEASVNPSGGSPNYTYTWSPGGFTSQSVNTLSANTYTITITDNSNCSTTTTIVISQPVVLGASIDSSTPASCGNTNGAATASASGGTGPYTYNWLMTGGTGAQANGLAPATYTFVVTDANNCTATSTVTITSSSAFSASAIVNANVKCFGESDGSAAITANGGTPNYTYTWSPGGYLTSSVNTLSANTYTITVTDSQNCVSITTVSITEPILLTASVTSYSNTSCAASNGAAIVAATGGTGVYTYLWQPTGSTGMTATGLSSGQYTVEVTDANNCSANSTVTINQSTQLTILFSGITDVSCFGNSDGSVLASVSGGTNPYTYSWFPGGYTSAALSNVPAATYTIVVADQNGCFASDAVTLTEPPQLVASVSANPANVCAGNGSVLTSSGVGGSGGYQYVWSSAQTTNTITITPVSSVTYSVTITDAKGCTSVSQALINVNPIPSVQFTKSDSVGCAALCVNFNSSSNATSFQWNFGDGASDVGNSPRHCYNSEGNFIVTLTVTDNNGCANSFTSSDPISVNPSPVADFVASPIKTSIVDPTINFIDQSSNANFWLWYFGNINNDSSVIQNPSFTYEDTGYYTVKLFVANNFGCLDSMMLIIYIEDDFTFYVPNTFTPNGDALNEIFIPRSTGYDPSNYRFMIFDRWGNLIWETANILDGWDGKANNGKAIAQMDTYVWKVDIKVRNTKALKHYNGMINLVR